MFALQDKSKQQRLHKERERTAHGSQNTLAVKGINSRVIRTVSSSIPSAAQLLLLLSLHLQNGSQVRNHLIGLLAELSKTTDKNRLAPFLQLS